MTRAPWHSPTVALAQQLGAEAWGGGGQHSRTCLFPDPDFKGLRADLLVALPALGAEGHMWEGVSGVMGRPGRHTIPRVTRHGSGQSAESDTGLRGPGTGGHRGWCTLEWAFQVVVFTDGAPDE